MRIEKLLRYNVDLRTITPLFRVITKRNTGHWAYSRLMALLWFFTTTCHNYSVRRFNARYLKVKARPERRWALILVWALWSVVTALLLWFAWTL